MSALESWYAVCISTKGKQKPQLIRHSPFVTSFSVPTRFELIHHTRLQLDKGVVGKGCCYALPLHNVDTFLTEKCAFQQPKIHKEATKPHPIEAL